jgi:hypothetical protein
MDNLTGGFMKALIVTIVMATALAGCATSGGSATSQDAPSSVASGSAPRVMYYGADPATVASFKTGVTTIDQAENLLGKPAGAVRTPAGNQIIAYVKYRNEDVNGDRTPETGTALPKRHKIRYTTMLAFDVQGRLINVRNRTDDLGDSSPSALGHFDNGDILTSEGGLP